MYILITRRGPFLAFAHFAANLFAYNNLRMHIKAEHILVTRRAAAHFPPSFYHLTESPAYSVPQLESQFRFSRVDLNLQMCAVAGAAGENR